MIEEVRIRRDYVYMTAAPANGLAGHFGETVIMSLFSAF